MQALQRHERRVHRAASPSRCWRASRSRCARRPGAIPAYDVRAIEARLVAAARRWDDDLKTRSSTRSAKARGNELFRASRPAFPAGYREEFPARAAVPDIEMMARLDASDAARAEPLPAARGAAGHAALPALPPGRARAALRQPADARAHGAARCSTSVPIASSRTARRPIAMHDFGMQPALPNADVEVDTLHAVFEDAFARVFRGEVENDDFNRSWSRRAFPPTRSSCCAPMRSTCARSASRFRRPSSSDARGARRRSPACWSSSSRRASTPRAGNGAGSRGAEQERAIEAALDDVENLSEDRVLRQFLALMQRDDAHELLAARRAGQAPHVPVVQVRPVEGAGAARAAADVRDLRLLAALRGRPPARRQGRARRAALVRPARGLPHRGARPREGADGEERGHRAGRLARAASC